MGVKVKVTNPGNETFMRGLKKLMKERPTIANQIAREMADEAVKRAKEYFKSGGPSEQRWAALYFAGEEVGQSTPQWWPEGKTGEDGKGRREKNRSSWDPLDDTGALMDSIKIFGSTRQGKSASVSFGSDSPYATLHEFGGSPLDDPAENWMSRKGADNRWTKRAESIPARPFLAPALMEVERDRAFQSEIKNRIKREFKKVLDSAR